MNDLKGEFVLQKDKEEKQSDKTKIEAKEIKTQHQETLKPKHHVKVDDTTRHKVHFYSAFSTNPDGITFQNQEADEMIILMIRRHFITNFGWLLLGLLLIFFPITFAYLFSFFSFIQVSGAVISVALLFYYLIVFGFFLVNFTIWYFNVALITNMRIVDVDVKGILFRDVAETNLNLIQDVTYKQFGAIPSFFNYGDILVQTAGTLPNFEFEQAPKPGEITRIIGNFIGI